MGSCLSQNANAPKSTTTGPTCTTAPVYSRACKHSHESSLTKNINHDRLTMVVPFESPAGIALGEVSVLDERMSQLTSQVHNNRQRRPEQLGGDAHHDRLGRVTEYFRAMPVTPTLAVKMLPPKKRLATRRSLSVNLPKTARNLPRIGSI